MTPYHHSLSHAHKWGGAPEDYMPINEFMDTTKLHFGDYRHRAILHNSFGVGICELVFGATIETSAGRTIPVRWIAEEHVKEDCGFIPSVKDWIKTLQPEPWMRKVAMKSTEVELV